MLPVAGRLDCECASDSWPDRRSRSSGRPRLITTAHGVHRPQVLLAHVAFATNRWDQLMGGACARRAAVYVLSSSARASVQP